MADPFGEKEGKTYPVIRESFVKEQPKVVVGEQPTVSVKEQPKVIIADSSKKGNGKKTHPKKNLGKKKKV